MGYILHVHDLEGMGPDGVGFGQALGLVLRSSPASAMTFKKVK